MESSQLHAAATRILRKNGYRADGRKVGATPPRQRVFEARLVRVPIGGQPKPRKGK